MGRALSVNVVVVDEAHNPVLLEAGSTVPAWASDQVGDHCFEGEAGEDGDKPARKPRQNATK